MRKLTALVAGGAVLWFGSRASAVTIQEDFKTNPAERGWRAFGAGELFAWDQAGGAMAVTWDSSLANSYFYLPLGFTLTKADEFTLAFDLRLDEVKLGTFELAIGLLNFADATRPGFLRGTGSDSPNLVEFDYFPDWSSVDATTSDSAGAMQFNYDFPVALTPGSTYRVILKHSAGEGLLGGEIYLDGALQTAFSKSYPNTNFTDFRVDTLALCSYSGANASADMYARGLVDNVVLDAPMLVGNVRGALTGTGWEVKVRSSTNVVYALQRAADLKAWADVGAEVPGTGGEIVLRDANAAAEHGFYRVKARR